MFGLQGASTEEYNASQATSTPDFQVITDCSSIPVRQQAASSPATGPVWRPTMQADVARATTRISEPLLEAKGLKPRC